MKGFTPNEQFDGDMSVLSLSGVTPPAVHPAALVLVAIAAALAGRRAVARLQEGHDGPGAIGKPRAK
jgi:hypothetical protein